MRYIDFLNKLYEKIERDTGFGALTTVRTKDKEDIDEAIINSEKNVKVHMNVGAGVIIREDENLRKQVLLLQRAADDHWPLHWEFPRGKCDKPVGEDIRKCTKREVKEETGLDVIPLVLIDILEYTADKGTRKSKCYNFLCELKNPDQKISLSKEHSDYKWVSEVGEVEMLVLPDQKKTIEKVLNSDRPIVSYPENEFTKNNEVPE